MKYFIISIMLLVIFYLFSKKENFYNLESVDDTLKSLEPETGDVGPKGPLGDVGEIGLQGEKGETPSYVTRGPDGYMGPKGDRGDTKIGPKGPKGIKGPPGLYEYPNGVEFKDNKMIINKYHLCFKDKCLTEDDFKAIKNEENLFIFKNPTCQKCFLQKTNDLSSDYQIAFISKNSLDINQKIKPILAENDKYIYISPSFDSAKIRVFNEDDKAKTKIKIANSISGLQFHQIYLDSKYRLVTNSNSADTPIVLEECNTASLNQKWKYNPINNLIKSKSTGKCLYSNEPSKNGGRISVATCDPNDKNQKWLYNKDKMQIRQMTNWSKCLDAPSTGMQNKIHLWNCNENNKNQHWVSMETNPTYYNISNQYNTCLSKINDEKVGLSYCYKNNDNQNWQYDNITKQLKSKLGNCLNYEKVGEDNMINLKKCDPTSNSQKWIYDSEKQRLSQKDQCIETMDRNYYDYDLGTRKCNGSNRQKIDLV